MKKGKRIYLDHAATTPVSHEALKEMEPYFGRAFGNPSSLHSFGQEASRALDGARERVAKLMEAEFREVIFTGSATEANNLALRGSVRGITRNVTHLPAGKAGNNAKDLNKSPRPKIIVSAIEHESVLETARDLKNEGVEVVEIPVDAGGVVDLKKLEASLDENTILVSVTYGNNVVGTIQPISEIAKIIREHKRNLQLSTFNYPLLHADAVQAFQYLSCNVNDLGVDPVRNSPPQGPSGAQSAGVISNGVDMMTLSSHKIYGPKGAGALYMRKNYKSQIPNHKQIQNSNDRKSKHWNLEFGAWNLPPIKSVATGGGQEFGLRSGTENIPAIVGFAKAAEEAIKIREKEAKRVEELKELLWKEIKKVAPQAIRHAVEVKTLPHILNVAFPDASKNLVARLDALGLAVSSGAACSARSQEASYVLREMGIPEELARRSIRFSLGRETTKEEVKKSIQAIKSALC